MEMKEKVAHTPTPWRVNGTAVEGQRAWVCSFNSCGSNDDKQDRINGEFIVRAVNRDHAFEALLSAAKSLVDVIGEGSKVGMYLPSDLYDRFNEAIAQAEARP